MKSSTWTGKSLAPAQQRHFLTQANLRRICAVCAFALSLAFELYCLFYLGTQPSFAEPTSLEYRALQGLYFLALATGHLFSSYRASWLFEHRMLLLAVCVIAAAIPAVLSFATVWQTGFLGRALTWTACGLCFCCMKIYWLTYFNIHFSTSTEIELSLSFMAATLLFAALSIIQPTEQVLGALGAGIAVAVLVAGMALFHSFPDERRPLIYSSRQFSDFLVSDSLAVFCQGIVFGFAIVAIARFGTTALIPAALGLALGCAVSLLVLVLRRNESYSLGLLLRRLLPVVIGLFLFSPLLESVWQLVCVCIALAFFSYIQTRKATLGVILNNRMNLNPITHHALVPLPQIAGMFLGFLGFLLVQQFIAADGAVLFLIMMVMVFVILVGKFLSDFRRSSGKAAAVLGATIGFAKANGEAAGAKVAAAADSINGLPGGFNAISENDSLAAEPSADASAIYQRFIVERCEAISEKFSFTRREAEVFVYLVRGRNAEYIANTLYLSLATTKTHIYHIYAKLGVNSHQQLISYFEMFGQEETILS